MAAEIIRLTPSGSSRSHRLESSMMDYRRFERAKGGLKGTLQATIVLLALLPMIGEAPAQAVVCGGDYVCLPDALTTAPTSLGEQSPFLAKAVSAATDPRCPAIPVDVIAESPEERTVACSAASTALELLGQCGIAPRRPLHLEISRHVRHPFGKHSIFGFFDDRLETAFVTQEANVESLVADTPYSEFPRRDFYRSLIVHEVVHGVMHQNLKRQPTSHAANEYPAYALQIASLPSDVRSKFLQSIPNNAGPNQYVLNDYVLLFDPFYFAAHAYRHFSTSDGCAPIVALLHGEVAFIPTLPP
jgi:hypothetical protein